MRAGLPCKFDQSPVNEIIGIGEHYSHFFFDPFSHPGANQKPLEPFVLTCRLSRW
jgi:hypothetical protein